MFDFSAHLKQLRQQKGVTQKQLSIETGISERGIQNYELGMRKPTYEILISLADYFNVSIDYLTGHGLFADWELIMANKNQVIASIEELLPEFSSFRLSEMDEATLIRILPAFLRHVDLSETGTLQLYFYV